MSDATVNPQGTLPDGEDVSGEIPECVHGFERPAGLRSPSTYSVRGWRRRSLRKSTDLPSAIARAETTHRALSLHWDIPKFLRSIFQAPDYTGGFEYDDIYRILSDQVILQGRGSDFRCLTCKEHLETTYGDDGLKALDVVINTALATLGMESNPANSTSSSRLSPAERAHITFKVPNNPRLAPFERALSWLCAAMRIPPPYEQANRDNDGADDFDQKFYQITPMPASSRELSTGKAAPPWYWDRSSPRPSTFCWTSLFKRGIIVESSTPRTWGVGLEVSFDMMVSLAGVEHMYQIGTGVILLGFFTALVPISRHEETKSIQWHLETNEAGIDPDHLNCTSGEWFCTTDLEMLRKARCFVGWFEEAHVMLGTRQLATDEARRLKWTYGLKLHRETVELTGHEVGIQVGANMGPISFTAQSASTFTRRTIEIRFGSSEQFGQALRQNEKEVALVIDAKSRQAWLVPLVSWILHLCHTYYIEKVGQGDTPIPFAERSSDGATATISAVESQGDTVVFGSNDPKKIPETLRQLWLRISINIGVSRQNRKDPGRNRIFAAEAMDIATSRDSNLKELPVSEVSASWVKFAKLAKVTTICANLGNAIVPVPPSGKRCQCCTLLEGQDFLAAHTWSLAQLLKQDGSSFSQLERDGLSFRDGTSWRVSNGLQGLWTKCHAGDNPECRDIWGDTPTSSSVLQRPEKVNGRDVARTDEMEDTPVCNERAFESGVVVFGGREVLEVRASMLETRNITQAWFGSFNLFSQQGLAGN